MLLQMAKEIRIRLAIDSHESKHQWMARCRKNKEVREKATEMAMRSPYGIEWIARNICEVKWNVENPVATYGPKPKPPKVFKGTIFSFPS